MKRLPPIIIILLILLSACSNTALDESKQPEALPIPSESILPTEDPRLKQIEITSEIDNAQSQVVFSITNNCDSTIWSEIFFKITSGTISVVDGGKINVEELNSVHTSSIRVDVSTVENLIICAEVTRCSFAELTTDAT